MVEYGGSYAEVTQNNALGADTCYNTTRLNGPIHDAIYTKYNEKIYSRSMGTVHLAARNTGTIPEKFFFHE